MLNLIKPLVFRPLLLSIFIFIVSFFVSSCGYTLRGDHRPFFEDYGLKTLYIMPVKNDSYRAGVEIMLYNTIRKRFAQGGYVRIVDNQSNADATLAATVTSAASGPQAIVRADQFAPIGTGPSDVQVASSYSVSLGVSFALLNHHGVGLWRSGFLRSKSVQAATYFGVLGSTSALINESEFERALGDLAVSIVTDAEESMNARF